MSDNNERRFEYDGKIYRAVPCKCSITACNVCDFANHDDCGEDESGSNCYYREIDEVLS